MKTSMSEKGQITIPGAAGPACGQFLDVKAEAGNMVLTKRISEDAFTAVIGIIALLGSTDEAVEDLGGRAEKT